MFATLERTLDAVGPDRASLIRAISSGEENANDRCAGLSAAYERRSPPVSSSRRRDYRHHLLLYRDNVRKTSQGGKLAP